MLAHHANCRIATLVGELQLAIGGHHDQAIALHARNRLRHGGAALVQTLSDASAHGGDSLFLKLKDGSQIHLCRINQGSHIAPSSLAWHVL